MRVDTYTKLQIQIRYHANILKTYCKSIWRYTKDILETN